ncbi:putative acyltransfersase [Chytriomyces sp. MP71]|nr:putative acyltransfersase [Chytriomyces sp. MP71]
MASPPRLNELSLASPSSMQSMPNAGSTEISYVPYEGEQQLALIANLIETDLSEPYTVYTYRYFLHAWPHLSFLAIHGDVCVGVIVSKCDLHRGVRKRGYLAMLAVKSDYRKRGIGGALIQRTIRAMIDEEDADEIVLETEITNKGAQSLYENLGFIRDKRLARYYLNGNDAYRLKLLLK